MPIITARRRSPCSACGILIYRGESIDYTLATGARHLACADQQGERRYNEHPTACTLCGVALGRHEGHLAVVEREEGGAFLREWRATCVDVGACNARIRAVYPPGG